jgi:hypothetical protein
MDDLNIQAAFETIFHRYAYVQGARWNDARMIALEVMGRHGNDTINYQTATAILDEIDREVKHEQEA